MMQPVKIIEHQPIMLAGFNFFGDPFGMSAEWTEENEIGRLWKRFGAYLHKNMPRLKHIRNPKACYEVHVQNEETAQKGNLDVFAGIEITRIKDVPVDLLIRILPATQYAIFTIHGQKIASDWPLDIYLNWLPNSGYQSAHPFSFQLYDERFKGMDRLDESALDMYVPIEIKADAEAKTKNE